jgi:hypothetical protein
VSETRKEIRERSLGYIKEEIGQKKERLAFDI